MVMERLTKRLEDGQAAFHECHGTCGTCDGANCYCIGPMVDRLAAYEDTGIDPDELRIIGDIKRFKYEIIFGSKADRLKELSDADNAGRLIVLPCKVGDMVYEVCNNTDACSGCRNYEGIYGSGESWCTRIDDVDLRSYPNIAERPLCEKQFMEVVEHRPKADWIFNHRNDFGKTVFLTREEAEAALKEVDHV